VAGGRAGSGAIPGIGAGGRAANLMAITIGNVIGGVLVGGAYWFAFLLPNGA
jgi:formate/nitrite transporter FocA (FNT family)